MIRLIDLFKYYKRLGHQDAAIHELEQAINAAAPGLLARDQDWYSTWSSAVEAPASFDNDWNGIMAAAAVAGAKFLKSLLPSGRLNLDGVSTSQANTTTLASKDPAHPPQHVSFWMGNGSLSPIASLIFRLLPLALSISSRAGTKTTNSTKA